MSRLSAIFAAEGKCFIPFVTAGHPDLETTTEIILRLAEAGSHIVEIGIPFSDPIADGPIIQKSSFAALQNNYSIADYLELVRQVRKKTEVGLIFMTYLNPVLKYGLPRLERDASRAGLDGILISDLTPEEYELMEPFTQLDPVFLVAPTSSDQRIEKICRNCRGFVYLVARTGVTGRQSTLGDSLPHTIERIRRCSTLPIAVGFGISNADDVRKVWEHADGAVVGSVIVDYIERHRGHSDLPGRVGVFVREQLIPAPENRAVPIEPANRKSSGFIS